MVRLTHVALDFAARMASIAQPPAKLRHDLVVAATEAVGVVRPLSAHLSILPPKPSERHPSQIKGMGRALKCQQRGQKQERESHAPKIA